MTKKSVNKTMLLIAAWLMWASISNVQAAQVVNANIANDWPNIANDWPNSRYTVHNNGTVTDMVTGLMWQQCSVGQTGADCSGGTASVHNWQAALALAGTDSTADYNNWRLPNKNELSSLVAYDRYNPSTNEVVFPNTAAYYWSSSPYAINSDNAWYVYFNNGFVYGSSRADGHRVRLVRSGQ